MRGDSVVVEPYHLEPVEKISPYIAELLSQTDQRMVLSIAGESGCGKSETAVALLGGLKSHDIDGIVFSQDDYFILPPKTNDRTRRADLDWVGPKEVRLDLLDAHLSAFMQGGDVIEKPLVDYNQDAVLSEVKSCAGARIALAEGTYTTILETPSIRIFIDRTHMQTRAHREKRNRDASELDAFTEQVLEKEHRIISTHKARADIIISEDGSVTFSA